MHELLQTLDIAVMKKLLLEVGARSLRRGTLRRCKPHIARRGRLHLAVGLGSKLSPCQIWVGSGTESASEESAQAEVGVGETSGIGREAEGIRRGLVIKRVTGILGQAEVCRPEAGEQRRYICCCSGVFGARIGG